VNQNLPSVSKIFKQIHPVATENEKKSIDKIECRNNHKLHLFVNEVSVRIPPRKVPSAFLHFFKNIFHYFFILKS